MFPLSPNKRLAFGLTWAEKTKRLVSSSGVDWLPDPGAALNSPDSLIEICSLDVASRKHFDESVPSVRGVDIV